ncbi:MAG: TIGR02206 family membrane protein [Candidatus Omnitrophica bacterium]|nr:TIGR02206 family membrane protein [Candidatus Omnitrophota bacterium]
MRHVHPFALWGADHLTALGLVLAAIAALIIVAPSLRRQQDLPLRRACALLLLANEAGSLAWAAAHGHVRVPLQLCDLAAFLTIWSLWSVQPWACELAYFWGLAGSTQALLTPDLPWGFPDYWWIKFFATHGGVVIGVVYLAASGRVAPSGGSVWRVWLITNGYVALAGIVNWLWGTNYGYLSHKPMHPSLLDAFGPWPWYILAMDLAALGLFLLCYTPFINHKEGRWQRASARRS